jgi:GTP cyclohydrolase II
VRDDGLLFGKDLNLWSKDPGIAKSTLGVLLYFAKLERKTGLYRAIKMYNARIRWWGHV